MKLRDYGEINLIERIRKDTTGGPAVICGISDDAAVVEIAGARNYRLITIDTIVEKIHFPGGTKARDIGCKALAVNISDIAAMGGVAKEAVISLAAPADLEVAYADELLSGIRDMAGRFDINIVGGDTVSSPVLVVTVALTGEVERENLVLRSGARAGDAICVTGDLGGSLEGKHLKFIPRLREARALVENFSINSMIDISDGLAIDLHRLLQESKAGGRIEAQEIPVSAAAKKGAQKKGGKPLEAALADGEDFELLFTMNPDDTTAAGELMKKEFDLKLSVIGEITDSPGTLYLVEESGKEIKLGKIGYDHFG